MTIRIDGKFDFMLHLDFMEAISRVSGPETRLVVDLENVQSIDSAGVGMLLMLRSYAGENIADVRIINCPGPVVQTLKTMRLDHLVNLESC